MKEIYLDYVNGSPLPPEVLNGMIPYLSSEFGNPQSLHTYGRVARKAIEDARSEVAQLIGAKSGEIYFTSSGSEGNSWIIHGVPPAYSKKGKHILSSNIEHISIAKSLKHWEKRGGEVSYLSVDSYGRIPPERVREKVKPETVLVTIHHAQSEIGTVQPIQKIVETLRETGALVHSDGVSIAGTQPLDVDMLGVDYYTLSAQSVYGPKGVGALYIRKGKKINPLIEGGNQEDGRRGGLENVPGIVGFGIAARLARENLTLRYRNLSGLRDVLIQEIQKRIPAATLTGDPVDRLSYHASFNFSGLDGEALVLYLSANGVASATGSSCLTGSLEVPSVLTALGVSPAQARGTLLLTLGWDSTLEGVRESAVMIQRGYEMIRKMSGRQ